MNTRIRELRKNLNLTQKEFGCKVGLQASTINDIEHNRCKVNERLQIAICSKFNVNEKWLKYGQGNMFIEIDKKLNDFLEIFNKLSPSLQDYLIKSAKALLETQTK